MMIVIAQFNTNVPIIINWSNLCQLSSHEARGITLKILSENVTFIILGPTKQNNMSGFIDRLPSFGFGWRRWQPRARALALQGQWDKKTLSFKEEYKFEYVHNGETQ
jgi:hypothetical protein